MVRLAKNPGVKNAANGRPKTVLSPVERDNPDRYPTLIRFLEATGKVQHISQATMMRARYLYLRGGNTEDIAKELNIKPVVVDRWALCFSWDEERDRRLFEQFRKIKGTDGLYGKNISQRHDRIAGSLEQIAERLLQKHANGEIQLSTQDLSRLTGIIKSTQEIRRTSRGEDIQRKEERRDINVNISVPGTMEKIANALVTYSDRPKLKVVQTKTIAVGNEDEIGNDTEYETADGTSETSS